MSLTAERLRELFHYDPETGIFRHTHNGKWRKRGGLIAGSNSTPGYRQILIDGRLCQAHRLAWLYVYGKWPGKELDHINRDRQDNRIANLREASRLQNSANRRASARHGVKGVTPARGRWQAQIKLDGKNYYLGLFDSAELAHSAYLAKAREFHGDFAA